MWMEWSSSTVRHVKTAPHHVSLRRAQQRAALALLIAVLLAAGVGGAEDHGELRGRSTEQVQDSVEHGEHRWADAFDARFLKDQVQGGRTGSDNKKSGKDVDNSETDKGGGLSKSSKADGDSNNRPKADKGADNGEASGDNGKPSKAAEDESKGDAHSASSKRDADKSGQNDDTKASKDHGDDRRKGGDNGDMGGDDGKSSKASGDKAGKVDDKVKSSKDNGGNGGKGDDNVKSSEDGDQSRGKGDEHAKPSANDDGGKQAGTTAAPPSSEAQGENRVEYTNDISNPTPDWIKHPAPWQSVPPVPPTQPPHVEAASDGEARSKRGSDEDEPLSQFEANFGYHKALLPPDRMDWITVGFSAIGLLIAAGGGIGGGGILVPLYMLCLKFRPKHAIALSNFTILGGSIANTYFNIQKTLPNGRSVIDWDIIVMMEPSTIAGAVMGSFASKYLPDFVLTVCLVIVLLGLSWRTLEKGISMFKKETLEMEKLETKTKETEMGRLGPVDKEESERLMPPTSCPEKPRKAMAPPGTPWEKILLLTACFVGCVVLTILKGSGDGSIIGIHCGSQAFWILGLGSIPWTIAFGALFRNMLMSEHEAKLKANHEFGEADIRWDATSTIKYPLICTLAGVFAGLFGVGGGIVKGPLMLEMGVHPSVAAATAAQMILFTTSAACVSFEVFGLLEPQYGLVCFVMGLVCTSVGQIGVDAYMKAAKRHSPPVLSIGAVMILSTGLVAVEAVDKFMTREFSSLFSPSPICAPN